MTIEVVIPTLRQKPVEWLVESLLRNSRPPDYITLVSNETQPFKLKYPGKVRLLRFSSKEYAIGYSDVVLRQNVGIFSALADIIVIQGDDQVAPPNMISDTLAAMEGNDYIWGNHQLTDFAGKTLDDIFLMDPRDGVSREDPIPPAWHGYQSCYGGMFAARTKFIQEFGAFDMALLGHHSSEDQQLGHRLMVAAGKNHVFILGQPFSWHPIELKRGDTRALNPLLKPMVNGCVDEHDLQETDIEGLRYLACSRCQYRRFTGSWNDLFQGRLCLRYKPEAVKTESLWLVEE